MSIFDCPTPGCQNPSNGFSRSIPPDPYLCDECAGNIEAVGKTEAKERFAKMLEDFADAADAFKTEAKEWFAKMLEDFADAIDQGEERPSGELVRDWAEEIRRL